MPRLKITQRTFGYRRQAQPASDAAQPWPQAHRRCRRERGPPRDPGHGQHGEPPGHRRGGRSHAHAHSQRRSCTTCARRRGPRRPRRASVAVRASRARPPDEAPRARRRATRCRLASRAARCRLHMRLPKLRGFTNPFRVEYQVVNVASSTRCSPTGARSGSTNWWRRAPFARANWSRCSATGDLSVKLEVTAHKFSATAREKITAAGGSITELAGLGCRRAHCLPVGVPYAGPAPQAAVHAWRHCAVPARFGDPDSGRLVSQPADLPDCRARTTASTGW